MRQEPVKILSTFYRVFTKQGEFIKETGVVYSVRARLLGITPVMTSNGPKDLPFVECGHKHKTKEAASPCFRRLKKQYEALRSEIALKGAKKARVTRSQRQGA